MGHGCPLLLSSFGGQNRSLKPVERLLSNISHKICFFFRFHQIQQAQR
ncbi:hypothetical protein M148_4453 [Bacteroides fragilis str. 1007-1-F |nr:hypothetical protein M148_4453 [Bacteroides fragilis str. 1007-1-F \